MADGCVPSVGDPNHGPVMASPSEATNSHMFPQPLGFSPVQDSLLSGPFTQHRATQETYGPTVSATAQDPLMQWYKNTDGPWVPHNFAPEGDGRSATRMNGLDAGGYSFQYSGRYRDNCVPSECDTTPPGIEPSDSGYGSNVAKLSIANISVYGEPLERCPETQSLAGHLSDLNFQGLDSGQSGLWHTQLPPFDYRTSQAEGKGMVCETCQRQVKTNSELKKHRQRHTKPHRCDVPGCSRTEGFSTTNDLDRHKRSIHPDEIVAGNRYQCTKGPCKNKEKVWPRADNFRAHLKRVHSLVDVSDEALEPYIYKPQPLTQDESTDDASNHQPPLGYDSGERHFSPSLETGFSPGLFSQNTEHGVGSSVHQESYSAMVLPTVPVSSTHMELGHMTGGTGPVDHVVESPSEDGRSSMPDHLEGITPSAVQTAQLAQESPPASLDAGERQSSLQFIIPGDLDQRTRTPKYPASAEIDSAFGAQSFFVPPEETPLDSAPGSPTFIAKDGSDASETSSVAVFSDRTSGQGLQDGTAQSTQRTGLAVPALDSLQLDLNSPESVRKAIEALENHGKLRELGFKKGSPVPAGKSDDNSARLRHENHQYRCTAENCDKTFARLCELKKHAKRHSKPYGCTFQGCHKRFGSKNDWKRHENSQHFLLEVWKCEEPRADKLSESCGKVSHRRETFKDHLTKYHGLPSYNLDTKLDKCRVGRNCEARFWCGFCEQIVEIQRKGLGAWTERFNHIDDHIHGRSGSVQKDMDDWKCVDPDAPRPAYLDASSSDTDDEDGIRAAPSHSTGFTRERQHGRAHSTETAKRKKNDAQHGERPVKRVRQDQNLGSGVISCCQCGDGNCRMSGPQCVSSSCQHVLCQNCI